MDYRKTLKASNYAKLDNNLPTRANSEVKLLKEGEDDFLDASQLFFEGGFISQVAEILCHVRLNKSDVANLKQLLNDLTSVLRCMWPDVRVHPFGSMVTGLGIKTSDLDCYIQISSDYPVQKLVNLARNLLKNYKLLFTEVFAITTARVPIVKFIHIPTGLKCDINFSNCGGVRNSNLIAFLLGLDPRALSLALMIKYWSKVYKFTGTNLMASYALTLMVIFYLQVKSVLPSVAQLQRHKQYHWVDGWNTAFNDSVELIKHNTQSLYELLGGFFDYYKSFDYTHFVISPYLGCPVKKQQLRDLIDLASAYGLYEQNVLSNKCKVIKSDTPICIQDPFDHSKNCTIAVSANLFIMILGQIEIIDRLFHKLPRDKFLRGMFTHTYELIMYQPKSGVHGEGKLRFRSRHTDVQEKPGYVLRYTPSGMSADMYNRTQSEYQYSNRYTYVTHPESFSRPTFISPQLNRTVNNEEPGLLLFRCFTFVLILIFVIWLLKA